MSTYGEIAREIVSTNQLRNFSSFLNERKIDKKEWSLILSEIVKIKNEKNSSMIYDLIFWEVDELMEPLDNFVFLLETLTRGGCDLSQINSILTNAKLENDKLPYFYERLKNSSDTILKESSGSILGLIGRISPRYLFDEIKNKEPNDTEKARLNSALYIASFRPFRAQDFKLPEFVFNYIIQSLKSNNKDIGSAATAIAVRLFDLDERFLDILREYIETSDTNKSNYLNAICYERLYYNRKSEVMLLIACSNSKSVDVIRTTLYVYAGKLIDEYIDIEDREDLQKDALRLIKSWHAINDLISPERDSFLLENIGDVNPDYSLEYIIKWITEEELIPVKHQFYYPKLFYSIFKNNEQYLIEFLRRLAQFNGKFDILINGILAGLIFDLRLKFDSQFKIYNSTVTRDLKRFLSNEAIQKEIDNLKADQIDDVPSKISIGLDLIKINPLASSDPNYKSLEHKKREFKDKLDFFERKKWILAECSNLLVNLSDLRGLNHTKLTRNYRSDTIGSLMTSCEAIRKELIRTDKEQINYSHIMNKFDYFSNIRKFLGHNWLQKKYSEGYPYHPILFWLSNTYDQSDLERLISESESVTNLEDKENKFQKVRLSIRSVAWLRHIDSCLDYFNKGNQQGKRTVINGLMDEGNFFQFLSQLEIANKLLEHGYEVELESPCGNRRIDIFASKDGVSVVFELATLDIYSELKYSNFASDIPDRLRNTMFTKLKQIDDYAKELKCPVILVFNLTHAHDVDLNGIVRCLQGSGVDNIGFKNGEIVKRYTTFERDPEFLERKEGKKLSAVIHYRNAFEVLEVKLEGDIIHNTTAENKLNENITKEISSAMFQT